MIMKTRKKIQAKRLDLDDSIETNRTGSKELHVPLRHLERVIEKDNVSVKNITLQRTAGDDEAEIIDDLLLEHEGTVHQKYAYFKDYDGTIQCKRNKLFDVSEDSVTIYRDYIDVIHDTYSLNREESFEEAVRDAAEYVNERIEELEAKLAHYRQYEDGIDLDAETFFEEHGKRDKFEL